MTRMERLGLDNNDMQTNPFGGDVLAKIASLSVVHGDECLPYEDPPFLMALDAESEGIGLAVAIACMRSLVKLDLSRNANLRGLPWHIGCLPKLEEFVVSDPGANSGKGPFLSAHPSSLVQKGSYSLNVYLSRLCSSIRTGVLNLSRLVLDELPSEIYRLSAISRFSHVLSMMEKAPLPQEQGFIYKALKPFYPEEFRLRKLDLSRNKLTRLPEEIKVFSTCLEALFIDYNQIQNLPLALGTFSRLTALSMDGIELHFPPPEVTLTCS